MSRSRVEKVGSISQKVGIRDVAELAGVSRSTVSRVLSGASNVSSEASRAVRAASERLGYRPDPIARAMRSGSSGCIGMVVPGIGNPFFAELVECIELGLQEHGLELMITDSQNSVEHERRRVRSLTTRRVDGLFVIPVDHVSSAESLKDAGDTPVVQLDRLVDGFAGDFVGVDNSVGVRSILDHLVDQGARHIVFVSGDASTSTGRSRLEAFDSQVRRLTDVRTDEAVLGSFTFEFGREAVRTLTARGPMAEAIVCGSDVIALGVLRELLAGGQGVPGDVLVTGFDGTRLVEVMNPPVTTVRQPLADIAAEAIRLLMSRIGGDTGSARRSEMSPSLVVRESSTRGVS